MPALNYADALHIGGREVDAVHLDGHRVYPLPPPFMEATLGNVTTPDLPADAVNGDVRIRAKLRVNSLTMTGGAAMVAMQRAAGAADLLFDWRATNTGGMDWRWSTTGTNYAHGPITHPAGTIVVGTDQWLGASRTVQGATTHYYGEVSTDEGATWQTITDNTAGSMTPFNSASPITVAGVPSGYGPLPGRIYWAQLEAINRARLVFPGQPGNYLSVPDPLPASALSIDAVARTSARWRQIPADYESLFTVAGERFLVRRQTTNGHLLVGCRNEANTSITTAPVAAPASWTDDQMVWLRAQAVIAAGNVTLTLSWAPDAPTEPTTWTQLSTHSAAATGFVANTGATYIGSNWTATAWRPWRGRIARLILRNVTAGTTALDVNENDAGKMATATTFVATSGQTVTVSDTAAGAAFVDSAGYMSTPDPGVLPTTFTIVSRSRFGAIDATFPVFANQNIGADPRSWWVYRALSQGRWFMEATPDGIWANRQARGTKVGNPIAAAGVDATAAVTVEMNRGGRCYMRWWTYSDATGQWTGDAPNYDTGAAISAFDVTTVLRVGGSWPIGSRVYWMELRTGTDPAAGTVVWRFDASERTGTGTTYTDPRGRVWTLPSATAIAPKVDPIVQPQAPAVIWRFDASEWPPDATALTDPRGRAWTATASPTHPASQPDREVA